MNLACRRAKTLGPNPLDRGGPLAEDRVAKEDRTVDFDQHSGVSDPRGPHSRCPDLAGIVVLHPVRRFDLQILVQIVVVTGGATTVDVVVERGVNAGGRRDERRFVCGPAVDPNPIDLQGVIDALQIDVGPGPGGRLLGL